MKYKSIEISYNYFHAITCKEFISNVRVVRNFHDTIATVVAIQTIKIFYALDNYSSIESLPRYNLSRFILANFQTVDKHSIEIFPRIPEFFFYFFFSFPSKILQISYDITYRHGQTDTNRRDI